MQHLGKIKRQLYHITTNDYLDIGANIVNADEQHVGTIVCWDEWQKTGLAVLNNACVEHQQQLFSNCQLLFWTHMRK